MLITTRALTAVCAVCSQTKFSATDPSEKLKEEKSGICKRTFHVLALSSNVWDLQYSIKKISAMLNKPVVFYFE